MVLNNIVEISVNSSKTIHKLTNLGISSKIGDVIYLEIDKLWKGSNLKIDVLCDVCGYKKSIQYNLYNKNIKKYNLYACSNSCASFKNKLTSLEKYGIENFVNVEKSKETKFLKYGDKNYQNVEKIKKTKLERWGDENFNNKEKIKQTNLNKWGVSCTLESDIIKEKIKKTNLQKYGNEDSRKSKIVVDKRKHTNLKKFGVESYMKTEEFIKKSKETSLERYGFLSPNQSDIIKKRKVKSMIEKYGYISNSCTEESKEKLRRTNLERYGVEYPMQVLEFIEKQQRNSKKVVKYDDNLYYQGSYEKHFLDYISDLKLINEIKRGPSVKYTLNNVDKIYYPDFYFEKYNLIVEIKSLYYYDKFFEKNIAKKQKCIDDGFNFLFIINKNYKIFDLIIEFLNFDLLPKYNFYEKKKIE
jgi:hypothetical protein